MEKLDKIKTSAKEHKYTIHAGMIIRSYPQH
jgi:hypothetical protein